MAQVRVGKHRGKTFEEVAQQDRSYCSWVFRERDLSRDLKRLQQYLHKEHGGIVCIGKHKNKFFNDVLQQDRDYCEWVVNLKNPGAFQDFVEYLKKHLEDDDEPAAKKAKIDVCKICFDRPVNSVFVPCGHICACFPCAARAEDKGCPICKNMCFVVKTFVS